MAGTEILIGLAISAATSIATSALAPKQKLLPVDKGRYDDIRIQGSEYGASIPIVYGRARLAGNVIYSDGVQPWVTTTPGRSGGKMGGGRPPEPPTNNYSYTTNIAIAICEGEVKGGLRRMWENTKVTINNDVSPLEGRTYEAESTANALTGNASIVRDLAASSGYKVQIGTGTLQFNGVEVPVTGTYDIKFSYSGVGIKYANMQIDGGASELVTFPSTGSLSLFTSKTISKTLTAGTHTIKLLQDGSSPTPHIDALAVNGTGVLLTPTNVTGVVDPDATYPSDLADPSRYYNARLLMDDYGTSTGRVNDLTEIPDYPDDIPPNDPSPIPPVIITPGGSTGGSTISGSAFRFYNGSETQLPDPMMIQIEGEAKVPAYRGVSYISLTKYQIPDGQMPNFTFEVDEGTHDLADILISLWSRVGLESSQLDVTALVGTFVEGLVIQSRTSLSDILDTLQITFAFDFVDINGKVTAVKRGSASVATIPSSDLRAHEDGTDVPPAELEGTYVNVEELPKQIDVSYLDRTKDYHTNVQPALMQIGYAEEPQTLVLPIVMTANQAHEVGMRVLNTIHLQRVTYGFTLPPKYSYLTPSDVITVSTIAGSTSTEAVSHNYALSTYGTVATASSTYFTDPYFYVASVNNGVRRTTAWGTNGNILNNGWNSGVNPATTPQWVALDFNQNRTISQIDVFSVASPETTSTPNTLTETSASTIVDFKVQYWNGTTWVDIASVTGNDKTWRQFKFTAITTSAIRVYVTAGTTGYARIAEIEAWGVESPTASIVTHKLRITQLQSGMPGLMKVQAVPDSASLYDQVAAGDAGAGTEAPPIEFPANTELVLMDIPPLMPEHTGFGFYAAACGRGTGNWYGAHLYREEIADSGSYERIGGFEVPATMGTVTNALSNTPTYTDIGGGQMIDTTSSISVSLYEGTLESFPQADLFDNPALNLCYIGGELVQFATASAVTNATSPYVRSYTLTNFRRGMNGTTAKIGTHSNGEAFVYMNNAVKRMREQVALLYTTSRYKAVSVGQPLNGAVVTTFNTGTGSTPPVATNLALSQVERVSPEGIAIISIRGTFNFGVYAGGQRAKVFVRRPLTGGGNEATWFNTGIIVVPDANNAGAFEFPAATNGSYIFQVIVTSPYDQQATSGHPQGTYSVTADNPIPSTPSAPTPTFDGQMVTWTWTASTDPRHSYYQVYNGATDTVLSDATRVDGNSYVEYPVNGIQRKVRAVSNQGTPSVLSTAGTFNIPAPSAPSGYAMAFDGVSILHSWTANPAYSYEIGDAGFTVIGRSRTGQWTELNPPSSRSITRYLRAVQYGASSSWTSAVTLTISAPAAPTSVSFDTANVTPFNITVDIVKPAGVNRDWIKRTVVEILRHSDSTVLNTMYFQGVAETVDISGRFLGATDRTIRVRATYEDFIGLGSSATTASPYTFIEIAAGDIDDDAIETRHISDDAIIAAHITDGILNTAHFAAGIRPVQIYTGSTTVLPALPDATNYPAGSTIFWTNAADTANQTLWKTVTGGAGAGSPYYSWTKTGAGSFAELTGTISAGQIGSGTITDSHINAASNFSRIGNTQIQASITGGGTISWTGSVMDWTDRLISIPNALSASGYIDFGPPNGTAMGAGVNSVSLSNVWDALFFRFPVGGSYNAANSGGNIAYNAAAAGWFVTNYSNYSSSFTVPSGYKDFMIAVRNGDNGHLYLWDGRIIQSGSQIDNGMAVSHNSITANQIVAGSITAAKIQAGAITAEKLAVGLQTGNLVVNASFENRYTVVTGDYYQTAGVTAGTIVPEGWKSTTNNVTSVTAASAGIAAADGTYVMRLVGASSNVKSKAMPVTAGATYLVSVKAYGVGVSGAALYVGLSEGTAIDANGYVTQTSYTGIETGFTVPSSWGTYGTPRVSPFYYTVPAGVTYVSFYIDHNASGTIYIDDVVFAKQFGSTYIQNGAITTDLIAANAVRAQNIQVGTFSESMQLNSKFVDGAAGYYHTVSSGSNGTQITIPTSPAATDYSTGSDSSAIPSEWTNITSVPYLQIPNTNPTLYGNWIPLDVNDTYYIEIWARTTSGTSTVSAGVYTDAGAFTGRVFASTSVGTTWTKLSGVVGKTGTGANYKAWNDTTLGASTKFRFYVTSTGSVNVRFAQVLISRMQTGNLIVNGTITGTQIQAGSVNADRLVANSITAGQIQVGAIGADQIAARAIRADKLAIGTATENLIDNPSFEQFDVSNVPLNWKIIEGSGGGTFLSTPTTTSASADGAYSMAMASGADRGVGCLAVPVIAGETYSVRFKLKTTSTSGTYYIRMSEYNTTLPNGAYYIASATTGELVTRTSLTDLTNIFGGANEYMSGIAQTTLGSNVWVQKECVYTVPAGVKYVSFAVYHWGTANGTLYIDGVDMRKQIRGVVIEDGTVTATKIVAQSITATQLAARAVTADKIFTRTTDDNLILNPSFELFDSGTNFPHNWKIANGAGGSPTITASTATAAYEGDRSLSILNTSGVSVNDVVSEAVPVTAGEKYYVSFRAKVPTATAGNFSLHYLEATTTLAAGKYYLGDGAASDVQIFDTYHAFTDSATGAAFSNATTSTYMTTSWKRFEQEYTVPAGVKYISLAFRQTSGTNPIYFDGIQLRKYVTGVAIEDNTIRAPKIVAGSITADKIAVGAVGANLVLNPSFEDHTSLVPSGWVLGDGTATSIVSSTDYVADGSYSGKIANGGVATHYVSVAFPVVSTDTYILRFKLRSQASAGNYMVNINEYNSALATGKRYIGNHSNGEVVTRNTVPSVISYLNNTSGELMSSTGLALNTLNGAFSQKQVAYTPSSNAKYASLSFGISSAANGALYIDDVQVMKKTSGVFIENGTITAENLIIGGLSDNLVANGTFSNMSEGTIDAWAFYGDTDNFTSLPGTDGTNFYLSMSDDAGDIGATSRAFPVIPGSKIGIRYSVRGAGGDFPTVKGLFRATMPSTGTYFVRNYIGKGTETTPLSTATQTVNISKEIPTSSVWHTLEDTITVPSGMYWMSVALTTNVSGISVDYDDVIVRKMVGQAFISDLRADQIVANTGQIGLIFADQIKQSSYTPYETGSTYDLSNGADGAGNSGWVETSGSGTTYDLGTDTLSWTGTTNWDNTSSVYSPSYGVIKAGINGYFEFVATENTTNKNVAGGLSGNVNFGSYSAGQYYYAIDYAWVLVGGTAAYIYESSTQTFSAGTFSAGDVFRVAVENGYVRFRKNGRLVWTSPRKPATGTIRSIVNPDFKGVIMFASGSGTQTVSTRAIVLNQEGSGQGWRLNPLTGTQTTQAEPVWVNNVGEIGTVADGGTDLNVGSEIKKHTVSSTNAWDTSVTTDQTIAAGDGYIQALPDSIAQSIMGLSFNSSWTTPTQSTIAIGLLFNAGNVSVIAGASTVASNIVTYINAVDVFRVSIEGTKVRCRKNGSVFYESVIAGGINIVYPVRGKFLLYQSGDRFSNISFTASSSGAGEFNSGITVRGRPIEDVVKLATQSIRGDNRYRGNDYSVPSNQVTGVLYDTYYVSWEDDMWFANISVTVSDYKTNATKNMDSIKSVRTRIYNKTGMLLKQINSPWNGRGVVFSGFIPRTYADMKQEAVFSFEFENLYGYSAPIYYSEAKWLDRTTDTWIEASQGVNLSYSLPTWFNASDLPTECQATPLTTTSVRVSWINANTASSGNHNVFYRKFKAGGYEGDDTDEGWTAGPTNVTGGTADITGLQANTRYEFSVINNAVTYSRSNIGQCRTFLLVPAASNYGAPSALAGAASSTTNINLSWVKNDTTGYTKTEIFYVTGTGVPTASDTQVGSGFTGTTASQGSLTANTTYTFRARNNYNSGANYSDWSNAITVTTQATSNSTLPTNVSVVGTGYYSVSVNWTANGGATTHLVQLADYSDISFSSPVYNTSSTTKPRPISGLLSGTAYRARVSADGGTTWSTQAVGSTYEYYDTGPGRDCVLETEPFTHILPDGTIVESPAMDIKVGDRAVGSHAGSKGVEYAYVTQVKPCIVNTLYTVTTELGHIVRCSETHKPITSWDDTSGTEIRLLETGNSVLVYDKITNSIVLDKIVNISVETGEFRIIKFSLDSADHTYIAGGIVAHNRKEDIY